MTLRIYAAFGVSQTPSTYIVKGGNEWKTEKSLSYIIIDLKMH